MTAELPPGWTSAALGQVVAPRKGKHTPDPSDPRPYLSLDNIESHTSRITDWERSSDYSSQSSRLFAGDVAYARMRPYLNKLALIDREALGSAEFIVLPTMSLILPSFLCYRLLSHDFVRFADQHSTGDRPRLKWAQMRNFPIELPPLAEQERIVAAIEEHFSRLDAVDASLDVAEIRCRSLTRSVIVGSIPTELPDDWQLKTVVEAGGTGLGRQRSPRYHSGTNMKPYLRVANVFEDRIDTSSIMEMHFEEADFEKYRLREGDVLLNEGQSPELLGRPAIYRGDPPGVAFTNSLIRFVPGPGVIPEWALLVFRRHMHSRRFMRESHITTNIAHLALGRFRTVEFPIPPLDTQQELVASTRAALSSIDQTIVQIQSARAKTNGIRRAVLAAAFSGELVLQDPTDEPAAVLLERIAASQRTTTTLQEVSA